MRQEIPARAVTARKAEMEGWLEAAVRFYDGEALEKTSPERHRLFAESYRKVGRRLGLPPSARVLDAGCGCGELAGGLEGAVRRVVGVDLSLASLRQARRFHPRSAFLGADLHRLPFRTGAFDAVSAITSVEFCRDRAMVLREFGRVIREGGRLYLDVRNRAFLPFRLFAPMLSILRRLGFLEPYPAEGFRDLSLEEWLAALSGEGFSLLSLHSSAWPWNFGPPLSRIKNIIIQAVKVLLPIRHQYMAGMVLEMRPGEAAGRGAPHREARPAR